MLDNEKGKQSLQDQGKNWGTIKTCMNLENMFGEYGDYKGVALLSRFLGKIETYTIENDLRNGFKVHYFTVR